LIQSYVQSAKTASEELCSQCIILASFKFQNSGETFVLLDLPNDTHTTVLRSQS
jgi:hypothetical protein